MSFLNPEYFWLFLFIIAIFIKNDFKKIGFTSYAYMISFVFIILALSRPVIEQAPIETQEVLGDVIIGVDLSYSMKATDIAPTRLGFAKEVLTNLVRSKTQNRFGVLGFTTNAIILSPLTEDSELLLHLFNAIDEKLIITKGSAVMPALRLARKMSNSKDVSVILLTDGADEFEYVEEALYAKENNLIVNVLMLATNIGATLEDEKGDFLTDELGDIVVSRKNSAISLICSKSGGVYSRDMDEILSALDSQSNAEYKSNVVVVQNIELFYHFVLLAIGMFLVGVTTLKKYFIALFLFFGITLNANVLDIVKDENRVLYEKAVLLYKEGEYEKSLEMFKSVKSHKPSVKANVYYNCGNALVRMQKFAKAREYFTKSLTLVYSKEADENMQYIKGVTERKEMSTGQQKAERKKDLAKKRENSKKSESGGSSNMKVSTSASGGEKNKGKKSRQASRIDLNSGKAKLSSKQYELINVRRVDEKRPW